MRDERQALAGLSARVRPASRARAANLLLGKVGCGEGSECVMQRGGLLAGAELGAVVEVHPVGEMRETELQARGFHLGEELILAVEAAILVVAGVVGIFQLAGLQDVDRDVVFGCEGECGGEFTARQGRRVGDDGEHAVAEDSVRDVGEICGVGAAGVGDE